MQFNSGAGLVITIKCSMGFVLGRVVTAPVDHEETRKPGMIRNSGQGCHNTSLIRFASHDISGCS